MFNSTLSNRSINFAKPLGWLKKISVVAMLVLAFSSTSIIGGSSSKGEQAEHQQIQLLADGENPHEDKEKEDGDWPLIDWIIPILIS